MGQQMIEFGLLLPALITLKQNKDTVKRGSLEHPPAQILPRPGARAATGMPPAAGASGSPSCLFRPIPITCRLLCERRLCDFVVVAWVARSPSSKGALRWCRDRTSQHNTPSANSPSYSKGLVSNRKIIPNMTRMCLGCRNVQMLLRVSGPPSSQGCSACVSPAILSNRFG